MSQKVSLRFKESKLLAHFKSAFANHFSVVLELLQNARRAGATRIELEYSPGRLVISDNGAGVDDFQNLLSLGESGWSQATQDEEGPYGMGFLAAVYASEQVEVRSKGQLLAFNSQRALERDELETVDQPGYTRAGAEVVLHGYVYPEGPYNTFYSRLSTELQGFPVEVVFNGQPIQRPHAPDEQDVDLGIGRGRLAIHQDPLWFTHTKRARTSVYLQGVRVWEDNAIAGDASAGVVHLDPKQFRGMFPDRNRLHEQGAATQRIREALRRVAAQRLLALKATQSPKQFTAGEAYVLAKGLGHMDVYNDVDYIPCTWLSEITDVPFEVRPFEDPGYLEPLHGDRGFTRAELVQLGRPVADVAVKYLSEESVNLSNALRALNALILDVPLGHGHWMMELVALSGDEIDVQVELVKPGRAVEVSGARTSEFNGQLQTCEAIRYTVTMDDGTLQRVEWREACRVELEDSNNRIAVPSGCTSIDETVLRQFSRYYWDDEEHDDVLSDDHDEVLDALRELLGVAPEVGVKLKLEAALRTYPELRNRRIEFTLDDLGALTHIALDGETKLVATKG